MLQKINTERLICDGCGCELSVNCNDRVYFTKESPLLYVQIIFHAAEDRTLRPADLCAGCRKDFYILATQYSNMKDALNDRT